MSGFTAFQPLHAVCQYWSLPVAVPFGQWHRYARLYSLYGLSDRRRKNVVRPQTASTMPMTGRRTLSSRNSQIQIPIAPVSLLARVRHPAVSSLEASQTPAR